MVVRCAEPHVIHQHGKPEHHTAHTHCAAKLEMPRVVDLGVFALFPSIDDLCSLFFYRYAFLQCSVRKSAISIAIRMAVRLLVFLCFCTALSCTSGGERVRLDARGVVRVGVLEDGGDAGLARPLEGARRLDIAWVPCFAAEV